MQSTPAGVINEQTYLALEANSPGRNEYVAGEIHAMPRASLRHNATAGNFYSLLRSHLRGSPCRVFMSDARVHVAKQQAYYSPDLVASCDGSLQTLSDNIQAVPSPLRIIEGLSPSSEGIDRREKALAYRTLPSLRESVLVSQDCARVEIHRRNGDIGWDKRVLTPSDTIELASVELALVFAALYAEAGIELATGAT